MKTYKCERGEIKYRMPNVPEAMMLFGEIGIDGSEGKKVEINGMIAVAKLMEAIRPLVIKVDISFGKTKIDSYEGLLEDYRSITIVSELVNAIFNALNGVTPGKKK